MKRLLPLLFLLPSVALILYARRAAESDATSYEVRVRVDSGGFEFPADVQLCVTSEPPIADGDPIDPGQLVADGWATVLLGKPGLVTLRLHALRLRDGQAGTTGVMVGKPQKFELATGNEPPSWTLAVTPDECRSALSAIRR